MQKKEANFTTRFAHWSRLNIPAPAVFEIKHTRGKATFPLREIRTHQKAALLAAVSTKPFAYKIPDDSRSYKPFDMCLFGTMDAYVVIAYPQGYVCIGAEIFFEKTKDMTSLTYPAALKIAAYSGHF